jgi:hypothetical protein
MSKVSVNTIPLTPSSAKLKLISDLLGEAMTPINQAQQMNADNLSLMEAYHIIQATKRIQQTVDRTQQWLNGMVELKDSY